MTRLKEAPSLPYLAGVFGRTLPSPQLRLVKAHMGEVGPEMTIQMTTPDGAVVHLEFLLRRAAYAIEAPQKGHD